MAGALVWAIGVEEDGVEENGCQSGAVTETRESAWTPGGDGCSAGDPIKTDDDAPRSVEEVSRIAARSRLLEQFHLSLVDLRELPARPRHTLSLGDLHG